MLNGSEREEILQPRTMQVLVCLARANGAIVSRDDLIMSCWGGVVVSDDAINRVIGQLRRICAGICAGALAIETITKVGYRLLCVDGRRMGTPGAPINSGLPASESVAARLRPAVPQRLRYKRSRLALAGVGALLVGGATASAWQLWHRPAQVRGAQVVLEAFPVNGKGVPYAFATTLRDAMANSQGQIRHTTMLDPGQPVPPGGWRMAGDISGENGLVHVYGHLTRAGSDAEIWSPRLDLAPGHAHAADIGQKLGTALRCIVETDARMAGTATHEALSAYAAYCQENGADDPDVGREVAALRATVGADPKFLPAWEDLGFFLPELARPAQGAEKRALLDEGRHAALTAYRLDTKSPRALIVLSRYVAARDFAQREALLRQAVASPMDWFPTAHQQYAYFLGSVGLLRKSMAEHQRVLDYEPFNDNDAGAFVHLQAYVGDYEAAQARLAQLIANEPGATKLRTLRFSLALSLRDWPVARDTLAHLPVDRLTRMQAALVDALVANDRRRVEAALAEFRTIPAPDRNEEIAVVDALAAGGHGEDALAYIEQHLDGDNIRWLANIYQPSFRQTRASSAFTRFVEKTGLLAYWRDVKIAPDFCHDANSPRFCEGL